MTLDKIYAIRDEQKFRKKLKTWIEQRCKKFGYDRLSEGEQRFMRVQGFCWEVNGNAFQGFFDNSHGAFAHAIYDDLRLIGAKNTATLLKRAIQIFPRGRVPVDDEQRQGELQKMLKKKGIEKQFDELSRAFYQSDPDGLGNLVWNYVRKNQAHFDLEIAPLPKQKPIKFGKPKHYRHLKLKDSLEYPIWFSAQDVKGLNSDWLKPVVSPKNNLSEAVVQHAAKSFDLPTITFQIEETQEYGTGQFNADNNCLNNIWFWIKGKWVDLDDLGGLAKPITLVAIPQIQGKKNVRFPLGKDKYFALSE